MSKTQSTLGEIESNVSSDDETPVGALQLTTTRDVSEGAKLMLDTKHWEPARAYEVIETRSNSMDIKRGEKVVTLRDRGETWQHDTSSFEHTVYVMAPGDAPVLACAECDTVVDPAEFARRDGYEYVCKSCE